MRLKIKILIHQRKHLSGVLKKYLCLAKNAKPFPILYCSVKILYKFFN